MMSEEELKELGEDIKAHGLKMPIVFYVTKDDQNLLLDGRNRLDALAMVGCLFTEVDANQGSTSAH